MNRSIEIHQEEIREIPNCMIVTPFAEQLDAYNTNDFIQKVNNIIDAGFYRLIFNLSRLEYISSAWDLGSSFLKRVKSLGGDIVYLNMTPRIKEVFNLLGFINLFHFADNIDQAISFFHLG
jgi:anti-anti-sigma factor